MIKNKIYFFIACSAFFFSTFFLFSQEKIISLGGKSGWPLLSVKDNVEIGKGRFVYDSLQLKTDTAQVRASTDLLLTFENSLVADSAAKYSLVSSDFVHTHKTLRGKSAGLSRGLKGGIKLSGSPRSLFGKEGFTDSFSIDFWLYPSLVDTGETIFLWRSSRLVENYPLLQAITASFNKGKMVWSFRNVFANQKMVENEVVLSSNASIIPDTWAHHALEYNAKNATIEYRINGILEAIVHTTEDGKEGSSALYILLGKKAMVEIASNFTGSLDDFRIEHFPPDTTSLNLYHVEGGRFETQPIDCASLGSEILSLSGVCQTPPHTALQFFVRSSDSLYGWTDSSPAWIPVVLDRPIENVEGRYVQVAGELYTDGLGSKTPQITELIVHYREKQLPIAPFEIFAENRDEQVALSWKIGSDPSIDGFNVYIGEKPGEYLLKVIDVGMCNSYTINKLENGKLYYFAVAAYSKQQDGKLLLGPLTKEVVGRPMRK